MNQDGETEMPDIRKAVQTDRILLEKMYLKDIENHQERAKAFADDLILKFRTILGFVDSNLAGYVTAAENLYKIGHLLDEWRIEDPFL